jgi:hypothetical protein
MNMNQQAKTVLIGMLILMFAAPLFLRAEPALYSLALTNSSRLWLEGDSSLHKYQSEATVVNMETEIALELAVEELRTTILTKAPAPKPQVGVFEVTIPIEKMNGSKMGLASRLHSTLKYEKYPNIVFTLTSYSYTVNPTIPEQIDITAVGRLAMSGKTNDVTLEMAALMKGDVVVVTGQKDLLMSDFGVKPPKLLMIKTDDKVVIHWDLNVTLVPKETKEVQTVATVP